MAFDDMKGARRSKKRSPFKPGSPEDTFFQTIDGGKE